MRYRATKGLNLSLNVQGPLIPAFTFPLLFAPGEGWEYGVGLDWAGWMVERVNGGITLEEYMNKNIWAPLGVTSMCFFPKQNPAVMRKLVDMSDREGGITIFGTTCNPEGKMAYTDNTIWNMDTEGCAGGSGGYGAPLDYHKLLHSILTDDEKILKKSTVEEMFKPQLNNAGRVAFTGKLKIPEINQMYGGMPPGTKIDYGIGGQLIMEDLDGRKKGTMSWGGYPNLIWFIDRVGGMSGIMGSQINPPGDPKVTQLCYQWQKEIYNKARNSKSRL
jgi:CubicO group peptidase (beta-lactamase class C family)